MKYLGRLRYTTQYIPPLGSVRIQFKAKHYFVMLSERHKPKAGQVVILGPIHPIPQICNDAPTKSNTPCMHGLRALIAEFSLYDYSSVHLQGSEAASARHPARNSVSCIQKRSHKDVLRGRPGDGAVLEESSIGNAAYIPE